MRVHGLYTLPLKAEPARARELINSCHGGNEGAQRGCSDSLMIASWIRSYILLHRIFSSICCSHSSNMVTGCVPTELLQVITSADNSHTSLHFTLFWFTVAAIFVKDTLVHFWSDLQQYLCKMLQSSHSSQNSY